MRITTKVELLALLDAATKDGEGFVENWSLDPLIANPERFKGSDPTYLPPPPGTAPSAMQQLHFCYFGQGANNRLRTMVYLVDGAVGPTADLFAALIAGARADGAAVPGATLISRSPAMEWRKPGYVTFCVDLPGWKFLEDTVDGQKQCRAIYFAVQALDTPPGTTQPNRSFYNARIVPVMVQGQSSDVVVLENYHLDPETRQPRPLNQPTTDEYKYDIFLTMAIEGSATGEVLPMIIDPGGKNIGPP